MDQVHGGPKTKSRVEKFTGLTKYAFREFINDRINDRLQSALESEADESPEPEPVEEISADTSGKPDVVTTDEELQAYSIVKEILRDTVVEERIHLQDFAAYCNIVLDGSRRKNIVRLKEILRDTVVEERIHLQDFAAYCNIVLDGSRRKNIVRLRFNTKIKRIGILNEENREIQHPVDSPERILDHAEAIRARVERLL